METELRNTSWSRQKKTNDDINGGGTLENKLNCKLLNIELIEIENEIVYEYFLPSFVC